MGGKALKNSSISRMTLSQFENIRDYVMQKLKLDFVGHRIEVLKAYATKSDFGNVSFVMSSDGLTIDPMTYFKEMFLSNEIVANDNRYSLEVQGHQVDISLVPSDRFDMYSDYHAYNGLGRMIGHVAHDMGLYLTHSGLIYKVMVDGQKVDTIHIANTWRSILTLLGYSVQRWEEGFHTLEDVMTYIASGKYFSSEVFADWQHKDIPQGHRLSIKLTMAEWVDSHPAVPSMAKSKEDWNAIVMKDIQDLGIRVHEAIHAFCQRQHRSKLAGEKYNGNLVSTWTGRQSKQLGELLQRVRDAFGGAEQVVDWVLGASEGDIKAKVLELHQVA